MVGDKEIEAAARAVATADWRFEIDEFREPKRWSEAVDAYNLTNNNWRFRYDEIARAALSAAARVRAEPVAWTGSWSLNALSHGYEGFIYPEEAEAHSIPLFTHPAPQLSEPVEVKPLEWVKRGNDYFADTVVGQYCVGLVHTSFRTVLRCITQGQWADIEVSGDDGLEDARDAAQADYERRILSALTAGKPEQECATEGCDKPATDYFERGGVGSRYCHGCYVKVQAVTTPPTAGGGDD